MTNTEKMKEVLRGVGDNLRAARGTTDKIPFNDLVEQSSGLEVIPKTYILVTEDGEQIPGVVVEEGEEVVLTAGPHDIRKGLTAVTGDGVITGDKDIPAYHTTEGFEFIPAGSSMTINLYSDNCQFTKLQALICAFNTTMTDSFATEKVVINSYTYDVKSTDPLSNVTVDPENQTINLGITNESDSPVIIRFITYREEV